MRRDLCKEAQGRQAAEPRAPAAPRRAAEADRYDQKLKTAYNAGVTYIGGLMSKLDQPGGADRMVNEVSTEMEKLHKQAEAKKLAQNQINQPNVQNQVNRKVEGPGMSAMVV